jgi:hypothetical protein
LPPFRYDEIHWSADVKQQETESAMRLQSPQPQNIRSHFGSVLEKGDQILARSQSARGEDIVVKKLSR